MENLPSLEKKHYEQTEKLQKEITTLQKEVKGLFSKLVNGSLTKSAPFPYGIQEEPVWWIGEYGWEVRMPHLKSLTFWFCQPDGISNPVMSKL